MCFSLTAFHEDDLTIFLHCDQYFRSYRSVLPILGSAGIFLLEEASARILCAVRRAACVRHSG